MLCARSANLTQLHQVLNAKDSRASSSNINITRINLDDVKALTEIAHEVGIATDYHINEAPMLDQPHFKITTAIALLSLRTTGPRSMK